MLHDQVSFERDAYAPREYSDDDLTAIEMHHDIVGMATDDQGNVRLTGWRRHLVGKLDAHQCSHPEQVIIDVPNPHGVWAVQVCTGCGEQTKKVCHHVRSDWNKAGTVLLCGNCGIDGT